MDVCNYFYSNGRKAIEYKIVHAKGLDELELNVMKEINIGWQPFGAPQQMTIFVNKLPYLVMGQAMVKYEEENEQDKENS
jgi:hypothetical protein